MVKDFAAATSYPALRYAILPGRLDARWLGFQTCCLQERDDFIVKLRVPIENRKTVWAGFWKALTQLLYYPLRSRMWSDVEVQDLAASVLDHEEAVQQLERQRGTVKKSKATITSR